MLRKLVSYEVSLALSVLGVVMMGRSAEPSSTIVDRQGLDALVLHPAVRRGSCVFLLAGVAETSRPPFDLRCPRPTRSFVAGYHTEYSGMRWGLFQTAEYINMIVLSALAVTLFFGGWQFPWMHSLDRFGPIWFLLKLGRSS